MQIIERNYEDMRALINKAGGRYAGVVFIKKNGERRTMNVQPAKLKFHVKGDKASEQAQRAAKTRAENNPHLMNVWDVTKKAPRSINLNTVERITVDGETFEYGKAA